MPTHVAKDLSGQSFSVDLNFDNNKKLQWKNSSGNSVDALVLNNNNHLILSPSSSSTNIGVGIAAPTVKLHVDNGSVVTLSGATGYGVFGDTAGQHVAISKTQVIAKNNATTAGDLILQNDGGNVGVGTASPTVKLNVQNGTGVTLAGASGFLALGSPSGAHIAISNNQIQGKANGTTTAALLLNDLGGNVGIGISPQVPLHVDGGTAVTLAGATGFISSGSTSSNHVAISNSQVQSKSNATTAANLILNNLGGNVGVGGSAAAVKLHVEGGTGITLSGATGFLATGATSSSHVAVSDTTIQAKGSATTAASLLVNPLGGAVGVGSSSPTVKFHVEGGTGISLAGATGFIVAGSTAASHIAISDTAIQSKSNATTATDFAINGLGGNVGVGISPAVKLHVDGGNAITLGGATGFIAAGPSTSAHVAIDTGNIQAKSNATTATTLSLNPLGGGVQIVATPSGTPTANSLYKDNIIKGWAEIDGTGAVTLNDHFNVTGVSDDGVGQYGVVWDRDFANANYAAALGVIEFGGANIDVTYTAKVAGSVQVRVRDAGVLADADSVSIIAVGDQ